MLREAEIGDFHVPVCSEKDVLGLEISINDIQGVQVVKRKGYLSGVKLRDRVGKSLWSV